MPKKTPPVDWDTQADKWMKYIGDDPPEKILSRWADDHNKYLIASLVMRIRKLEAQLTTSRDGSGEHKDLRNPFNDPNNE